MTTTEFYTLDKASDKARRYYSQAFTPSYFVNSGSTIRKIIIDAIKTATPDNLSELTEFIVRVFSGDNIDVRPTKAKADPDIVVSRRLEKKLAETLDRPKYEVIIYAMFLSCINNKAKAFDLRPKENCISFTPAGKWPEFNGRYWSKKNRQTTRYGRLFGLINCNPMDNRQLELWINLMANNTTIKPELFPPTSFQFAYDERNYYMRDSGTLGSSCMRYTNVNARMSFYNFAAKAILVVKIDGKIAARALVWRLKNGKIFMDRVYSCQQVYENALLEYARRHKWYHKTSQGTGTDNVPDEIKNTIIKLRRGFNTGNGFPYLDTFKYLYWDNKGQGYLTNRLDNVRTSEGIMPYVELNDHANGRAHYQISCAASNDPINLLDRYILKNGYTFRADSVVVTMDGNIRDKKASIKIGRKWYPVLSSGRIIGAPNIMTHQCSCGNLILESRTQCEVCAAIARVNRRYVASLSTI